MPNRDSLSEACEPASFAARHIGPDENAALEMAKVMGYDSIDRLIDDVVPASIRREQSLDLPDGLSEREALERLENIMGNNRICRTLIGCGYSDCITPPVIQRNILENPGWYTAYTPYQAEIAQGRMEALIAFQTMVTDLTAMDVANASLLDEGTAAAEAMAMCAGARMKGTRFLVAENCHPQTIDVLLTRAEPLGFSIELVKVKDIEGLVGEEKDPTLLGVLLQYPATDGEVSDYAEVTDKIHAAGGFVVVATDLLALTLLKPPGEWGADIVLGNSQRFGVPLGFGGPHAAFMACTDAMKRRLPGRLVGVSKDSDGRPALRLSLQTREQHIRREKATSNICTAQVLLAVLAAMYAVYHGPQGLRAIALGIHRRTVKLAKLLREGGLKLEHDHFFDTLKIYADPADKEALLERSQNAGINLRDYDGDFVGLSLDETSDDELCALVLEIFGMDSSDGEQEDCDAIPASLQRESEYLSHSVFHLYHTETEMLRYLRRLEGKDLALNASMIPLGSCTMKLNATAEMMPLSWQSVGGLHPFAPLDQSKGYVKMADELEAWLAEITGFAAVSLQPNAGSQGEFAGLLAIRRYHQERGDNERTVCLIPTSAHGTNPASAVMAGFTVVPVRCDEEGNIDVDDIKVKAAEHAEKLGALMITYPSTHGVFEESVKEICDCIHKNGGQVYLDGANMNAQVGLCRPGDIGGDVCHLNLHKTFSIPHGGGGPGVGPIGVAKHLQPYLPGHREWGQENEVGAVCAAPYGSASILTISWMYLAMMGAKGVTRATKIAILNANYIAHRLKSCFPVLYRGRNGLVAHECIVDLRPLKETSGIDVEDVAKRLMDYGYHAPTMSWPVPGTLMIEPTESESLVELDRFCDALISIHAEIEQVISGEADSENNVLKNAPHPAETLLAENWDRPYSRESAAYPSEWSRKSKFWPPVSRIDNVFGDRNLVCSCEGMEAYQ